MRIAAFVLTLLCTATPARAEAVLREDLRVEVPLTILATAVWLGAEGMKGELAPLECRWCGNNAVDDAARSALKWDNARAADAWSNASAGATPVLALGALALAEGLDGSSNRVGDDTFFVVEALALAGDVNVLTKMSVGRARPSQRGEADDNLSFYSGHTTATFALAAAAGTVATLRGYRFAPLVWGAGLAGAFATGYLRIAGDRHWLSDVVVGAVAGSVMGIGVPLLLHPAEGIAKARTARAQSATPVVSLAFAL